MSPRLPTVLALVLTPGMCGTSPCLTSVEVVELPGLLSTNTTSIRVSWDRGEHTMQPVIVTVQHMGYLSCGGGRRDYEEREVVVDASLVIIESLHPYSSYKIVLRTERQESGVTVTMETRQGVPQLRARKSTIDYAHKDSGTSLHFNWRPPAMASQCDKYCSEPWYYHYELRGLDKWSSEDAASGDIPYNQTWLYLHSLHPFSHYVLLVYITNTGGHYSRDIFLTLGKTTKPAQPHPPSHLQVEAFEDNYRHLSWVEPFPPTGEISGYNIRWRTNGTKRAFLGSQSVLPSNILCKEDLEMGNISTNQVCFTLKVLEPKKGYFLSVQALNKDVRTMSAWSEEVYAGPSSPELVTPGTIAIILVLGMAVIIGIIGILRTAYKVRNKLQFKQSIKHYLQESESVRSDSSMVTYVPETHYATPSQRSQQDPLPPLPSPMEDIPGYSRPQFNRPCRLGSGSHDEESPTHLPIENYFSYPTIHL